MILSTCWNITKHFFWKDYLIIVDILIMGLIPFLLLLILNGITFCKVKLSSVKNARISPRQRRDHDIAWMFILIGTVFLFCNIPSVILNIWEVRNCFSTKCADILNFQILFCKHLCFLSYHIGRFFPL